MSRNDALLGPTLNPFVRKLEGFAPLSDADRTMLERICAESRVFGPRVDLIHEGDPPDGVLLVMEGMVCRHKLRMTGQRQIVAYLLPGDLGDLDAALLKKMDHSITTLSTCRVVRIPTDVLESMVEASPAIAHSLRMSILVDEATLREWLVNVGCRSAVERIAHLFCELLVRFRAVGLAEGDSYALPLTQMDLAHTTGMSNVHVNRSLQELRRNGLLEFKGGRLTILNLPRLRTIAEFKTNYLHLGDHVAA